MTAVRQVVDALTDQERLQIIADHQRFERDGAIGDCLLRTVAQKISDHFGGHAGMAPVWMEHVASATYRHFALRFIANMDDGK